MSATINPERVEGAPAVESLAALRPRRRPWGLLAWAVVLLVAPLVIGSDKWMGIGVFALIAAISAVGLQVIMGFAGQISMGQAAFMAIGAYSAAWLGVDLEQPWWIWLPASALISGVFGAIFAPIAVRIRGLYLAVATLALVFIGLYVWETWTSFTGGGSGRTAAAVEINGQNLLDGYWSGDTQVFTLFQAWWYFILAVLAVVVLLTWNIKRSRLGRAMFAVRDRDIAAGVAGIPVTSTKVVAFAISSAFAGLSGALLAGYMGFISSTQWSLMLSVDIICMVVIGGLGSISGAVLGAFFFKAIPEVVNWLATFVPGISQDAKVEGGITAPLLSQFVYGLVIVLVLIFEPRGLNQMFRRAFAAVRARRERATQ